MAEGLGDPEVVALGVALAMAMGVRLSSSDNQGKLLAPLLTTAASKPLNKVEAFNMRQARKKIARKAPRPTDFVRAVEAVPENSLVDCNMFLYVVSHILDDKAVHDLASSKGTGSKKEPSESASMSSSPPGSFTRTRHAKPVSRTLHLNPSSPAGSRSKSPMPSSRSSVTMSMASDETRARLPLADQSPIPRKSDSMLNLSSVLSPGSMKALASIQVPGPATGSTIGRNIDDVTRLPFGSKISLRAASGRYAIVENDLENLSAHSPNPQPFIMLNASNRRDTAPVRVGDTIFLCLLNGKYVGAETDGTASAHRTNADSRVKWIVLDALDGTVRQNRQLQIGDSIVMKSCFGTLLRADPDGSTNASDSELTSHTTWQISKASLPYVPEWTRTRAVMMMSLMESSTLAPLDEDARLEQMPRLIQERVLVESLLSGLMGCASQWIDFSIQGKDGFPSFTLNKDVRLDSSMEFMVTRVLPLCSSAARARQFVDIHSRYEHGIVHHAFSAAIRDVLERLLIRVAQLEHQLRKDEMTLQRLWYYLQSWLNSLEYTMRLLEPASRVSGGGLLRLLHDFYVNEGEDHARDLYCVYVEKACKPYFAMLERWIYHGDISDPYDEFQIKVRDDLCKENLKRDFNDSYWDERYTIREDQVPSFLEDSSQKILMTGKYLNVIRQCDKHVKIEAHEPFTFSTNANEYRERVDRAFKEASGKLLTVLLDEAQLLPRLRSIKRYFLLDQGDFFLHFMDSAEEELLKNVSDIVSSRLESLLELSVRTSSVASLDVFHDDLSCNLQQHTLLQKLEAIHNMSDEHYLEKLRKLGRPASISSPEPSVTVNGAPFTGLEAFTLDYTVRWPLSLIISKKALTKYQLIFRHLFYIKHVERQLCNTWMQQQRMRELSIGTSFATSFALRQRMLHFLQNLLFYLMVEVLEPNWHFLEVAFAKVNTVDEVLASHNSFLDKCLKECLLTNHHLLKNLTTLLNTCLTFSNNIKRFSRSLSDESTDGDDTATNRCARLDIESKHALMMGTEKHYVGMVHECGQAFDERLQHFMAQLLERAQGQYDSHLANLCTRLDYNGFYARQSSSPH